MSNVEVMERSEMLKDISGFGMTMDKGLSAFVTALFRKAVACSFIETLYVIGNHFTVPEIDETGK